MANTTTERPTTVIKPVIVALNSELKTKVALAIQEFVTKVKDKHLS
jgi:hypothetical protein